MSLSYAVIRRDCFSFKVSLYKTFPCFFMWDFVCFSLEMFIELLSFPFFFSVYFCSVNDCVVCIVSNGCNQSSSTFAYVVFESLYRYINAFLRAGESSFSFSWHIIQSVCVVSGPFVEILSSSTSKIVPRILQKETAHMFIPLMRFFLYSLVSSSFLVLLRYSFEIIIIIITH